MSDRFDEFDSPASADPDPSDAGGSLTGWILVAVLFALSGWLWYMAAPTYVNWYVGAGSGLPTDANVQPDGRIPGRQPGELAVVFMDVGYGDGILIQTPDNRVTLVDGGEGSTPSGDDVPPYDWAYELYLPFFQLTGIDRIDTLITTVPISHHVGAQPDLIAHDAVEVGRLLRTGFPAENFSYRRLQAEAQAHEVPQEFMEPQQELDLGAGLRTRVLHGDAEAILPEDASHVLFLQYGDVRFLLMSDLPTEPAEEPGGERELVLNYAETLESEVLKVGQHGYHPSTSEELLGMVDPQHAVISTSNPPGPSRTVLDRLESADVPQIQRTDQAGHIAMYTDGNELRVETGVFDFLE